MPHTRVQSFSRVLFTDLYFIVFNQHTNQILYYGEQLCFDEAFDGDPFVCCGSSWHECEAPNNKKKV